MNLYETLTDIFGSIPGYDTGESIHSEDFKLPWHTPHTTTFLTVKWTCTHYSIERILPIIDGKPGIVFYSTFEEALAAYQFARSGVILPLAYQMYDRLEFHGFWENFGIEFYQSGPWIVLSQSIRGILGIKIGHGTYARPIVQNPPMHFATWPKRQKISKIACLPELQPWLETIEEAKWCTITPALHNQHAAEMVVNWEADACITNEAGLVRYNLTSLQKTWFRVMDFVWSGKIHEWYNQLSKLEESFGGLEFFPFPLSNMHYTAFLSHGWNKECNWSKEWLKWKKENPERNHPTYWHTREWVEALKPVTGITFWEAEACAKYFWMRLPTVEEFQTLAFNAQFNLPVHSPGFVSNTSTRKDIDTVHPLIGNVAKWCIWPDGTPVLCGWSSWDYDSRWSTTLVMPPENCDNNTGIFLVSGSLSTPDIRPQKEESAHIPRDINRPTSPFRQEWNESSINARAEDGKFTMYMWDKEYSFDVHSLSNLPQYEQTGTFQCVCNWAEECKVSGVLLADILKEIEWNWKPEDTFLYCESYPGKDGKTYTTCERIDRLLREDAPTMLITHLQTSHNRELVVLSDELGWPIRMWSNWVNWYKQVKALRHMRLQDTFRAGEWESRAGYPEDGTPRAGTRTIIGKISNRIQSPGWIIGTTQTRRVE